jgi:hypothetical protein
MSKEELKQYVPDTPEEWQKIGNYINHLGTSMSAILLLSDNKWWALASMLLTWLGGSIADYFQTSVKK